MNYNQICRSARARLHRQSGAFDLPSIMIGVAVVAILTVGVLAAIFGVIPWSQDHAAKQDLASVNTAQGAAYAKDGKYLNRDDIITAGWLSTDLPEPLIIDANPEGTCYVAVQTADTGHGFIVNHTDPAPRELTNQDTWCNGTTIDSDAVEPPATPTPVIDLASLQLRKLNVPGTQTPRASWVSDDARTIIASRAAVDSVYRSEDGGETFKSIGLPVAPTFMTAGKQGQHIFAGTYSAPYFSNDGGATWSKQPPLPLSSIQAVQMSSDGSKLVLAPGSKTNFAYTSNDAGATWTKHELPMEATYLTGVEISNDGKVIGVGTYASLMLSVDGGNTWSSLTVLKGMASEPKAISSDHRTMLSLGGGLPHISRDRGQSWSREPLPQESGAKDMAISKNGLSLVIVYADRTAVSTDGGASWDTSKWEQKLVKAELSDFGRSFVGIQSSDFYLGTFDERLQ